MAEVLSIRKLADRSEGERVKRYDPVTGDSYLADPATWIAKPWPLAGIAIEGKTPKHCSVAASFVARGLAEGWLSLENERVVHRSGGPPEDPWRVTHSFVHGDVLVLHTVEGDVRYQVSENPDKWPAKKDGEAGFGGDVRWFYELALER